MLHRIAVQWVGHHDWNGAIWSVFARNFLRYGYATLGFGQAYFSGPLPETVDYYTHHSILITIVLTELYRLFGIHEWVARLAACAATLVATVAFYVLVRKLFERTTALYATMIFSLCPMVLYFGRMYNHEAFELCWVVVSVLAYVRWKETRTSRDLAILAVSVFLAAMTAWPGYYLLVLLPLHYRLAVQNNDDRAVLVTMLLSVALSAFAIYLAHAYSLKGPRVFSEMQRSINKGWFSHQLDWGPTIGNRQLVKQELKLCMALFTIPVVALAAVGVASSIRQMLVRRRVDSANAMLLMLLGFGGAHLLLFKQEVMMHDYYLYYLVPGVAIAAGSAMREIGAALPSPTTRIATLGVIAMMFLVLSAESTLAIHREHALDRAFYVELGEWMNANTDFTDRVLFNVHIEGPFLMLYADRALVDEVDSWEKVRRAMAERTVLVMRAGRTPRLERYVRRRYPTEVVTRGGETVYVARSWVERHRAPTRL